MRAAEPSRSRLRRGTEAAACLRFLWVKRLAGRGLLGIHLQGSQSSGRGSGVGGGDGGGSQGNDEMRGWVRERLGGRVGK